MQSRDYLRPVPAKIYEFLRGFPEFEKPSYLRRPPKKTSLKSGAFGSHRGESLYSLVVALYWYTFVFAIVKILPSEIAVL